MLKRVIYTSYRVPHDESRLPQILTQSERNNATNAVTGVLFETHGCFLQVLEGDEASVNSLLQTLRNDARHRNMRIVHSERADNRLFEQWKMATPLLSQTQARSTFELLTRGSDVSRQIGLTYLKYLLTTETVSSVKPIPDASALRIAKTPVVLHTIHTNQQTSTILLLSTILCAIFADIGFFIAEYMDGVDSSLKMLQSYAMAVPGLLLAIWTTRRWGQDAGLTVSQVSAYITVAMHALWAGYGIHAPSFPLLGLAIVMGILSDKPANGIKLGLMSLALMTVAAILSFSPSTSAAFSQAIAPHHAILATILLPIVCMVILSAHRQQKSNAERFIADILDDLADAVEELRKSMAARDYFFSAISHEIRTPMHGAMSAVQVLSHPKASEAIKFRSVESLRDSLSALNRLLDDLLDVSRLEAGEFKLYNAPFNINLITENVIRFFSPAAEQGGNTIAANLLEKPLLLLGDQQRYRQMLSNFVGNAVKFTKGGNISIKIDRMDESASPLEARWMCEVTDSGIGIPLEEVNALFKPFSQASQHGFSATKGSGMGLAIVAGIARQMQGDAGVRSVEGEGSTFWFTFAMPIAGQPLQAVS
jgi:signal transduction histidine kinase